MSGNVGKTNPLSTSDDTVAAIEARKVDPEPFGGVLAFSGTLVYPDSERAIRAYLRRHLSPRSKQNALDALRRLTRMISGGRTNDPTLFPWATINFEQATTIRSGLHEKTLTGEFAPGTANLTLAHLRGLIRTMYGMDLVSDRQHEMTHSDALKSIRGSRVARGRSLAPREERALRAAARKLNGYRGTMLDTAIVFAVGAGLRREEIAGLPLKGVGDRELTVIGKGNVERLIPTDQQIREATEVWLEERAQISPPHENFFCSPHRSELELSPWGFWDLVRSTAHTAFGDKEPCGAACRCLKIVTGPHDFRRTFVTRLLELGLDLREVQRLAGHKSPETTARYDKRDLETLFEKRRNMKVIA